MISLPERYQAHGCKEKMIRLKEESAGPNEAFKSEGYSSFSSIHASFGRTGLFILFQLLDMCQITVHCFSRK